MEVDLGNLRKNPVNRVYRGTLRDTLLNNLDS